MGTKPVHAVLGLMVIGCALASGCRSGDTGSAGGAPGMIGGNTPKQGAFGRDPGGVANAPSSTIPTAAGQSPSSVYGNTQNPMLASSAASPAAGRSYPNGNVVGEDGSVSSSPPSGWTSPPRSNTVVPVSAATGNPGSRYPAAGMASGSSAGVMPASFQQPGQSGPPLAANGYPSQPAPAGTFPGGDPGQFRGQTGFTPPPAPANTGTSSMTFTPGATSGDVGRTAAPEVEGAPPGGPVYNVPGKP